MKTRAAIMEAFIKHRFYSTLDQNLSLSFKFDGKEMGSVIHPGKHHIIIEANDGTDEDTFSKVLLIVKGKVIRRWEPRHRNVRIETDLTTVSGDYYYIHVQQKDGGEAISSPVWIR
ncbi:MAG TPA: hypothetical protein VHR47_05905 [Bacillota bacterium]|nr:hypothetical protein [Bacillota bacterium]